MAINLEKINLQKEQVIDLKKKAGIGSRSQAQVVLALDFSGSMSSLYNNGTVQKTVERILPFGLAFDDNGEVDTYLFENRYNKVKQSVTLENAENYVNDKILGKYEMGGTNYAPVLNAIYDDFKPSKSGGLFGLGGTEQPMEYPVYIIFITDGDNFDKPETESVIKKMSEKGFFIQFIGIGNAGFSFLEKLDDMGGRKLDNVNFFNVNNLNSFSDEALYQGLMSEYPEWYKQARNLNLIK